MIFLDKIKEGFYEKYISRSILFINYLNCFFGCSHSKLEENSLIITKNVIESVNDCYPKVTAEYSDQKQKDLSENKIIDYSQFNAIEIGMKLNKVLKITEIEPNETLKVNDGIYDYVWYSSSDDTENGFVLINKKV